MTGKESWTLRIAYPLYQRTPGGGDAIYVTGEGETPEDARVQAENRRLDILQAVTLTEPVSEE